MLRCVASRVAVLRSAITQCTALHRTASVLAQKLHAEKKSCRYDRYTLFEIINRIRYQQSTRYQYHIIMLVISTYLLHCSYLWFEFCGYMLLLFI